MLRKDDQAKTAQGKPKQADASLDGKAAPEHNSTWQSLATRPGAIQPKLTVSQPGDPYEQEADHIAERVMGMATLPANSPQPNTPQSSSPKLSYSLVTSHEAQAKRPGCEEGDEGKLQRKEQGGDAGSPETAPPIVNEALNSSGQPLEPATRDFMEARFDQNFNQIRIHADETASAAARAVQAKAFTVGPEVVFGQGEYAPETKSGRKLLAHELAHFAQQRVPGAGSGSGSVSVFRRQATDTGENYDVVRFGERGEANLYRLSVAYGVSFSEVKRLNSHLEKENWVVRKKDLIKLPAGTLAKLGQPESGGVKTDGANSAEATRVEETTDQPTVAGTVPVETANTPADTTTTAAEIKSVQPELPKKSAQKETAATKKTVAKVLSSSTTLAHGLLHKYASFLPGSENYIPFSLDEKGLGQTLAQSYSKQASVVVAVLDLTQWIDRDDVAYEFVHRMTNRDLVAFDREVLARLKREMTGVWKTDEEAEEIARIEAILGLNAAIKVKRTTKTSKTAKKDNVPFYNQGNKEWKDRVLGKVATIGPKGCAVTAMAMAVSAISGKHVDPGEMDAYLDEHGGYSGDSVYWGKAAQAAGLTATRHVGFDVGILDQSLGAGKPCVISVNEDGHWVTVTDKRLENGRSVYTIHDPATGKAADMELENGALVGASGAFSKRSGKYIITLTK